jgi:hypothetical protein
MPLRPEEVQRLSQLTHEEQDKLIRIESHRSVLPPQNLPGFVEQPENPEAKLHPNPQLNVALEISRDYIKFPHYEISDQSFQQMKGMWLVDQHAIPYMMESIRNDALSPKNLHLLSQTLGVSKKDLHFDFAQKVYILPSDRVRSTYGPGYLRYRQSPIDGYLFRVHNQGKNSSEKICSLMPEHIFISQLDFVQVHFLYLLLFHY